MAYEFNEIIDCEVCGSHDLDSVLNLGAHPMCDDLVPVGDSRVCQEYLIEILFCSKCCTAHQRFQIPKHLLFPKDYHFRSRHTTDILNGMRQFTEACEKITGKFHGKKILDIGCNDGSLLSFFSQKGADTYGIEPTAAASDAASLGHKVINDFFTPVLAKEFVSEHGNPDLITFTNVFAHIENLREVIDALNILSSGKTMIVIENHYLGSILKKNQFDTFYHEHPRTYSYTSFTYIADALGMRIAKVDFPERYGGNIRVFMVSNKQIFTHDQLVELKGVEKNFRECFQQLAINIERWRVRKLEELSFYIKNNKLAAKAFPGRSAIPIKLLGLNEETISAVFEKSASSKIGHYIPGTRIPICSDDDFDEPETPLLNLAWHISDEIEGFMRSRGFKGKLINIIGAQDFIDHT